jgi:aspartyl-tRNA(Asn)/glutamyl-tRNA(Gln) amidotransferase subunit C
MSVSRDEVMHIARLAEMEVDEATLPTLADELSRILEYVAQLGAAAGGEQTRPFIAGPDTVRFRPDEVRPQPLAVKPADFAPAFKDGFFVVPRLGQFEDGAAEQ